MYILVQKFTNNNLSILTSLILDLKNIDKSKINEILKNAESDSKSELIDDQKKYLNDQKIDVLKSLSIN